jgi:hypothetical protein
MGGTTAHRRRLREVAHNTKNTVRLSRDTIRKVVMVRTTAVERLAVIPTARGQGIYRNVARLPQDEAAA